MWLLRNGKKKNLLKKFELRAVGPTTGKPSFYMASKRLEAFFMRFGFDIDNRICFMRSQL